MKKIASLLAIILFTAACVTTPQSRADELAYCKKMETEMGLQHTHSHSEAKGLGLNPMNVTHDRCRQMLASQ